MCGEIVDRLIDGATFEHSMEVIQDQGPVEGVRFIEVGQQGAGGPPIVLIQAEDGGCVGQLFGQLSTKEGLTAA